MPSRKRVSGGPDGVLAVDTETTGLFVQDGARVKVISVASARRPEGVAYFLDEMSNASVSALMDRIEGAEGLVFQNAKFDLHMLRAGMPEGTGRDLVGRVVWDTMLATRVLEGRRFPFSGLKPVSSALWGPSAVAGDYAISKWLKENRKARTRLWEAPRAMLAAYAVEDARNTWRLYERQLAVLDEHPEAGRMSGLVARELELMRVLYAMEQRGLGWDVERAREISERIERWCSRVERKFPFRATKPSAAKWFFDECDYVPTRLSAKTGKPAMDAETRASLIEQGAEWAREWDLWCRLQGARSMWYAGWTDKAVTKKGSRVGTIQTYFRQQGTVSMRLSVERINHQAIPQDYNLAWLTELGVETPRALISSGIDEWDLWELDVSQAEIRIMASLSREKKMLKVVESGRDIHDETTTELFNVTPEDGDEWKRWRAIGKRTNFAMAYGIGAREFVRQVRIHAGLDISENEARRYLDLHRKTYPRLALATRAAEMKARMRGGITLCSGMPRWFGPLEQQSLYKAFNQAIQGGVAEAMKDVMIAVEKEWPGTLVLQIHDSIVLRVSPGASENGIVEDVRALMVATFEGYFKTRFIVDVKKWETS